MAQHGGYRQPSNPAPVSGPGALSARTDGGPAKMDVTGMPYGDAQAFRDQQSAAPLSPPQKPEPPSFTGLGEPTQRPGEPVTSGADAGPGPSLADMGINPQDTNAELRAKLGPMVPVLVRQADSPNATAAFKQQVRELLARIG